jgi:hypothetical protein
VPAEDTGCKIYYQDTDSMHISVSDLGMLETEFCNVYHRELVGKDLGNFHSDFPEIRGEAPVAVESYFVGKKIYIDRLRNSKNNIGFHVRRKAVSLDAIIGDASRELPDLFSEIGTDKFDWRNWESGLSIDIHDKLIDVL